MADHTSSFSDPAAMDIDDASEQLAASTPPTSVGDDSSTHDTNENASSGGRAKRRRVSLNYNVKRLLDAQASQETLRPPTKSSKPRKASGLSGRTLVDKRHESPPDELENEDINMELVDDLEKMLARSPKGKGAVKPKKAERRQSLVSRAKSAASVLGKRTRDAYEAGKKRLGMVDEEDAPKKSRLLRELDTGTGGIWDEPGDELDLDALAEKPAQPPPAKRARTTTTTTKKDALKSAPKPPKPTPVDFDLMQKTSSGVMLRKYHNEALYAGQEAYIAPTQPSKQTKLQKKTADPSESATENLQATMKHLNFGLPMFEKFTRKVDEVDFKLPYDIHGPTQNKAMQKQPPKYTKIDKNRIVGDAKYEWKPKKQELSYCICKPETGCDEQCWNASLFYECDSTNCRLTPDVCGNRPFYELEVRAKKNTAFDRGVEVVKTEKRGHGVRATRWFEPGQIIMEYTGEVITEAECQKRMATTYQNAECYYVMEMEKGLILDGKKGSIARFINHSCDPNCEVKMSVVGRVRRIGIYAGAQGIMTGEELSYDYNFQNFSEFKQACYCGGQRCRGYLGKRLTENEVKKLNVEEQHSMRQMMEEASQRAEVEAAKKQAQARGWKGWAMVDWDEERAEKQRQKKELEANSARARRMAKREGKEVSS